MSVRDLDSHGMTRPAGAMFCLSHQRRSVVDHSQLLRGSLNGLLAIAIMLIGGLVLWIATPLAWLWVGSQIEGATDSLTTALLAMFAGVLASVMAIAWVLAALSRLVRTNAVARGLEDPGPVVLENVLIISAAIAIAVFGVWFFLLSGASPMPMGLNI